MSDRSNVVYIYDGSLNGLYCCIFESYLKNEIPIDILCDDAPQIFFYSTVTISTDIKKANRVYASIEKKMGGTSKYLINTGFLSGLQEKAIIIFNFIRLGYQHGARVSDMLADPTVSALHNIVKSVNNEKHLLLGFVRFSEYSGTLVAVIEPKNFVLPLMQGHFCARFPREQFMIFDKSHDVALLYHPYEAKIIEVSGIELPDTEDVEQNYRMLWTQYYNTIAIKERENFKCRSGHMPKRFWTNLTEMQPENQSTGGQRLLVIK